MARFTVASGNIEKAVDAIKEFTEQVNSKEEGCHLYRSLHSQENPLEFVHYMIFADKEAEEHHRQTPYVKIFVDILYPLLELKTVFTSYDAIAG